MLRNRQLPDKLYKFYFEIHRNNSMDKLLCNYFYEDIMETFNLIKNKIFY
jgi:hypothetical protein